MVISKYAKTSKYDHQSVSFEWLKKICGVLQKNGIESTLSPTKRDRQFSLQSLHYSELYNEYQRWYRDGEKRVPHDIDVASQCMLKNWVYGDGTHGRDFRLCTDSFTLEDTEFLIGRLADLGFGFRKVYMGKSKFGKDKYRLSICKRTGLVEFFQYIGEPDVADFSYKC